jgi:hypothetical protein
MDSSILPLETLLVEYDNTLDNFNQAQTDYFKLVKPDKNTIQFIGVSNGDFSETELQTNSYEYLTWDTDTVPGWNFNCVLVNESSAWGYPLPYPNGKQCASIQMGQQLWSDWVLFPEGSYTLTFYACGRPSMINPLDIYFGSDKKIGNFVPDKVWAKQEITFSVLSNIQERISFRGTITNKDMATAIQSIVITKNHNDIPTDTLTHIPKSQFFGTTGLETSYVSNIYECSTLCSNSTLCSGANYTPASGNCSLQSGEGTVTQHPSDYAVIPKSVKYLVEMNAYNTQLKKINAEIIQLTKTKVIPDVLKTNKKISIVSDELHERDVLLTNRQDELEALIARITPELDNVQSTSQLTLQSLKLWYGILLIIVIGIIVVILKMSAVGTALTSSLSRAIYASNAMPSVPTMPSIPFVK